MKCERTEPMVALSDDDIGQAGESESADADFGGALDRILEQLLGHLETMIDRRPLDALALSLVVQAAGNVRAATRTAQRVRRENAESARRRAALERYRTSATLMRRLGEAPALAMEEAKTHSEGCRGVIALWRSLGESLSGGEGWNEQELALARALTGSSDPALKTTRERARLERALDQDRQKPLADLVETVDRVMHGYIDRLAGILGRMGIDHRNLHEIVIELVHDKSFELSNMIGVEDRAAIARYRERTQARISGRFRWASARAFVAGRIRAWKSILNQRLAIESLEDDGDATESLGQAEMKKADWARRNLSAAIADFQKTLALGKSIGLPEVICPKPPKPEKATAVAEKRAERQTGDFEIERQSIQPAADRVLKAARPVAKSNRSELPQIQGFECAAGKPGRFEEERTCRQRAGGSQLTRDARGRFLPGSVVRQPRDARGRFRKAVASDSQRAERSEPSKCHACRTTCRPLRPTVSGLVHLRRVVPNVNGRDQATQSGIGGSGGMAEGCVTGHGAPNALADFAENVQNDGMNRMPGSDQVSESRSDLPPDSERGVAGDDER